MKPEELRIGNYATDSNFEFTVYGIDPIYIEAKIDSSNNIYSLNYENIEPIPLTEQWLIDLGLESRLVQPDMYYEYSIRNGFEIYCYMDASGNCLFWVEGPDADCFIVKCDKVHEFQNIYFSLTGKELNKTT